jgi:2,3-bisphosphoglycerate-independent phosphoglycerate mutase
LDKQGIYRFLVICDHTLGIEGSALYAFGESGGKGTDTVSRRFTEADAIASNIPARDATKFANKFFSKS